MAVVTTDYVHVAHRASELGCVIPSGIAILPENFSEVGARQELLFGSEASTIRKLLSDEKLPLTEILPSGERVRSVHNKHFEWAPLLFIAAALVSENPNAVSVALGVISNYATEFFKGSPGKSVKLKLVVERKKDKSCKLLSYEGDVEGLKSLADTIRRISDE